MNKRFGQNNFDLLRIFAASQVLLSHPIRYLHLDRPVWIAFLGHFPGVPIFFVTSGFLISASYERNVDLKNYCRNRVLRIYPGLWTCIFLTIVTVAIFGKINFFNKEAAGWLISQMIGIIYTPNFLKHYGVGAYHVTLWTIPVELQFYVILPFVYMVFRKITKSDKVKNILFCCLGVAFFILSFALIKMNLVPIEISKDDPSITNLLRHSFIPHLYMFLFGVILQRTRVYESKLIVGKGLYWLIGYTLYSVIVPSTAFFFMTKMLLLGIAAISVAYTKTHVGKKLLRGNDISYGVYIYQGLFINIFVEKFKEPNYYHYFIIIISTYLLAYLSWIFVEKPCLRFKKQSLNVASAAF